MTEQEQLLESWERLQKMEAELALRFYTILFRAHPELRAKFPQDMSVQREKLTEMLDLIVRGYTNTSNNYAEDELRDLGEMHARVHGVTIPDYGKVGGALLATFKHYEGSYWTESLHQHWADAYGWAVQYMLQEA